METLFYGNSRYRIGLVAANVGLFEGVTVFTLKRWMYFAKDGNLKATKIYLLEAKI